MLNDLIITKSKEIFKLLYYKRSKSYTFREYSLPIVLIYIKDIYH